MRNFHKTSKFVGLSKFDRNISTVLMILFLSSCGWFNRVTVDDICETHPQYCDDLNPDGWCLAEKSKIIHHRYRHEKSNSPRDDYHLMVFFENYQTCIGSAAQIRHVNNREKESLRMRGLMTAERELNRLQQQTKGINDPYLLYYHWSRDGDEQALKGFLEHEKNGRLESAELQVALASYYAKYDIEKTKNILLNALTLYAKEEDIDASIFSQLTSVYLELDDFENAYLWARVAVEYKADNIDLAAIELAAAQQLGSLDSVVEKADDLIELIESRKFAIR